MWADSRLSLIAGMGTLTHTVRHCMENPSASGLKVHRTSPLNRTIFLTGRRGSNTSPLTLRERRPAALRPVGEGSAIPPRRSLANFLVSSISCVIQSFAKNPGSCARNSGHSLRSGRKRCCAVEVFRKIFHVKRFLVQSNETRIVAGALVAERYLRQARLRRDSAKMTRTKAANGSESRPRNCAIFAALRSRNGSDHIICRERWSVVVIRRVAIVQHFIDSIRFRRVFISHLRTLSSLRSFNLDY